jgi:hypothetical protein
MTSGVPGTRLPGGDDPADVECIELEVLPGLRGAPLAPGCAGQGEGERADRGGAPSR